MAVISDNNPYGIPDDLVYSFPLIIRNGRWQFVDVKDISNFQEEYMCISARELMKEKKVALEACTHDDPLLSDDTWHQWHLAHICLCQTIQYFLVPCLW